MKLGLTNATILTAPGDYWMVQLHPQQARDRVADSIERYGSVESAVGHEGTAAIMSEVLGVEVAVSRQHFIQAPGQHVLAFKLNGRPESGQDMTRENIERMGYSFHLIYRWPPGKPNHVTAVTCEHCRKITKVQD